MRGLVFEGKTWEQYEDLRHSNKVIFKSLQKILKQLLREPDPAQGIGKPEPLKHQLAGLWSRRISQKDRVIYKFDEHYIYIFAIGGHYDDH